MNVLIACEESQTVCRAFREVGHNAFSCDIQECSGGHPEWHISGDVMRYLNPTKCENRIVFFTMDGEQHLVKKWDLIIAHPPCIFLSNVATRHHSLNTSTLERINDRTFKRIEAMQFFMNIANADCDRIAIENPVGVMNTAYRKPDQIIEPYFFAENEADTENYVTKRTCLWLKGLPILEHKAIVNNICDTPPLFADFTESIKKLSVVGLFGKYESGQNRCWEEVTHGSKRRSKTFDGVAKAMAEQWGKLERK